MANSPDRGTYLPTGWRVVGPGAESIAERARVYAADRLTAGSTADTLYAVQFTIPPSVNARPTVELLLDAVTEDIRRTWPECPRLLRDELLDRAPSRFGGARFEALSEPGKEWTGELIWRAVHPVVAGAAITTWALIEERKSFTRVSVRVTADDGLASVRGYVGAGQAQPAFIRALRSRVTPIWLGGPLQAHAVRTGDVVELIHSILPSQERSLPVALLAPLEDGGYVVDPEDLAWELLGRARLFVFQEHRQTFEFTDALGDRRMSCYWGATRAYMPGWTRHDDPYDHPLLVGDRLGDPVMRAAWLGELGVGVGAGLTLPPSLDDRRRSAVADTAPSTAADVAQASPSSSEARAGVAEEASSPSTEPAAAVAARQEGAAVQEERASGSSAALLEALIAEVRRLGSAMTTLTEEVERLRTISAVRASSTSAIERRLGRLEDLLEHMFVHATDPAASPADTMEEAATDTDDEGAPTLALVVQDAAETYSDALVFLDSAFTAASDSPYEDPERVRAILEAMGRIARRRRDGLLGTSLREAFSDLGIDYRGAIARTTPAKLREQYRFAYNGSLVEAEEHIVLGNTYDPRRCLRVYFSSRVATEPRFVIAHVGRHFEVRSTT
jgi:hypothetical protein